MLHYLTAGTPRPDRPALLLLHYFGGSARAWQPVMERLADTYYVVAVDLPGFGESPAPATDQVGVAAMTDAVAALLEQLNTGPYVLAGHSMSGKVALDLASRQPPNLRGLVLLAPSPPTPEPIPDAVRARLLSTHGQRPAADRTLEQITARPLPDAWRAVVIADNLRSAATAWRAWLTVGSREDITDRMNRVAVPALVLQGERDENIPPELVRRDVLPRLSRARLQLVPDAAHLLPLEAPDVVAAALRTFLEAVGQP